MQTEAPVKPPPLQPEKLEEQLLSTLKGGDLLLVVPPFATTRTPILGPLLLQNIARDLGYKAEVLFMNLLLAGHIGHDLYESVSYGQPFRQLGERLFARAAHGLPPLGTATELLMKPAESVFGTEPLYPIGDIEYKYLNIKSFQLDTFFQVEAICYDFMHTAVQTLASLKYPMFGCSANWEQNNCCTALLKGIKTHAPGTVTLMGGSNCEENMAHGLASLNDAADFIFAGESETTFRAFLENHKAGNLPKERVIRGKPFTQLDGNPLPDYSGFVTQKETFLGENYSGEWSVGYETSRGCWWGKCFFCGINGADRVAFREKSPGKALKDFQDISRQFPGRLVGLADKVMPVSYHDQLLPQLAASENCPPLFYEHRSNLSFQVMRQLRESGIGILKPGVEALSTGLLKTMNKGITAPENILMLRYAACLGIHVDWNLLWGIPGDRIEHYKESLEILPLLRHLCPPAILRHISIDRFSRYFKQPEHFGISNLRPWEVYRHVYPDSADLENIVYRFMGDYTCGSHENPGIIKDMAQEITRWKKDWGKTHLIMNPFADLFMIYDRRNIDAPGITHVVDLDKAREIMTPAPQASPLPENIRWAVEQQLGLLMDGMYVPLVTAPPDIMEEVETQNRGKTREATLC